ncbi:LacI family DNA-binding transcriptional regulator [Brachybacterium paraconglomeratum]|uniref:LacI family DNA-binding transcriptional regulator n=1 Tax=Brachybacterium paraconglomeratum TaxID=173362 RepID=UPI0037CC5A9D
MASSKDVAEKAGVSRSTVSQVLNGHGHRFSSETASRVVQAAEGLGYRPSAAARTLARGSSAVVVTLVPAITFGPRLRDFIDVLTRGLARSGYVNLLRLATTSDALEDGILDLRPHAVVSLAPLSASDKERLERHGARVIEQSQALQEHLDVAIGRHQAEHLARRGYRAIAAALPVDARERPFAQPRAAGALDWALRHDIAVLPTVHVDLGNHHPLDAIAALPDIPVGVAAYNDNVALAILGAAHQAGRRIPDELGIIGVDNTEVASIAYPTLTTLDFDLDYSAQQMLRAIDGAPLEPMAASQVEARLRVIDGESTSLSTGVMESLDQDGREPQP